MHSDFEFSFSFSLIFAFWEENCLKENVVKRKFVIFDGKFIWLHIRVTGKCRQISSPNAKACAIGWAKLPFLVWVRRGHCRIVDHFNIDNSFGKLPLNDYLSVPHTLRITMSICWLKIYYYWTSVARFYGPQPTQVGLPRLLLVSALASGLRDNWEEAALHWQPYSHAHTHTHTDAHAHVHAQAQAQAKCIWFIELWNCSTAIESRWAHRWSCPWSSSRESDSCCCWIWEALSTNLTDYFKGITENMPRITGYSAMVLHPIWCAFH